MHPNQIKCFQSRVRLLLVSDMQTSSMLNPAILARTVRLFDGTDRRTTTFVGNMTWKGLRRFPLGPPLLNIIILSHGMQSVFFGGEGAGATRRLKWR